MEKITLARPYAKALFLYAKENREIEKDFSLLSELVSLISFPKVKQYLSHPMHTHEQLISSLVNMLNLENTSPFKNFIALMVHAKKLCIASEIFEQFKRMRHDYEKTLNISVMTYLDLSEKQKEKLRHFLNQKLDRTISFSFKKESALLGGFLVHAGTMMIDGSVRGQLEKLEQTLKT